MIVRLEIQFGVAFNISKEHFIENIGNMEQMLYILSLLFLINYISGQPTCEDDEHGHDGDGWENRDCRTKCYTEGDLPTCNSFGNRVNRWRTECEPKTTPKKYKRGCGAKQPFYGRWDNIGCYLNVINKGNFKRLLEKDGANKAVGYQNMIEYASGTGRYDHERGIH